MQSKKVKIPLDLMFFLADAEGKMPNLDPNLGHLRAAVAFYNAKNGSNFDENEAISEYFRLFSG